MATRQLTRVPDQRRIPSVEVRQILDNAVSSQNIYDPDSLERKPWERLPGEPNELYDRFFYYLSIGPRRTLGNALEIYCNGLPLDERNLVYKSEKILWGNSFRNWRWRTRAELWDSFNRHLQSEDFKFRRDLNKNRRLDLLDKIMTKVEDGVEYLDPTKMNWVVATEAAKMVLNEYRNEYDDQPTQRRAVDTTAEIKSTRVEVTMQIGNKTLDPADVDNELYLDAVEGEVSSPDQETANDDPEVDDDESEEEEDSEESETSEETESGDETEKVEGVLVGSFTRR